MNLLISARGFPLTPAIEAHVRSRASRLLEHFDQIVSAKVMVGVDSGDGRQWAKLVLHTKGKDLFGQAKATDVYEAVDTLSAGMHEKMRRVKTRTRSPLHMRGRRSAQERLQRSMLGQQSLS